MHKNWKKTNVLEKMKEQAEKRSLQDLTVGPVLSWNNEKIKAHIDAILEMEGSKLITGGKPLTNHNIPSVYGSYEPTIVYVPFKHFRSAKKFKLLTSELFGPFTIVTDYSDKDIENLMDYLSRMQHLTAAIVSNDPIFTD